MRGLRVAVLAAAGVSGAVTLTAALLPQKHFASRPPLLHVALETAASLIALLADLPGFWPPPAGTAALMIWCYLARSQFSH